MRSVSGRLHPSVGMLPVLALLTVLPAGPALAAEPCDEACKQHEVAVLKAAEELVTQDRLEEAARRFEEVIQLRGTSRSALESARRAAWCMRQLGRPLEAIAYHDRVIAIARQRVQTAGGLEARSLDGRIRIELVKKLDLYRKADLADQERAVFEQLKAEYPFSLEVIERATAQAVMEGQDPLASEVTRYHNVIKASPNSVRGQRAALSIGRLMSEASRFVEAIAAYDQSVAHADEAIKAAKGFDRREVFKWKKRALFEKSRACCRAGLMEQSRVALQELKAEEYGTLLRPIDRRIMEAAVNEGAEQAQLENLYSQDEAADAIIDQAMAAANDARYDEATSLLDTVINGYPGPIAEDAAAQRLQVKEREYKQRANELITQSSKGDEDAPESEWERVRAMAREVISTSNRRKTASEAQFMIIESYYCQRHYTKALQAAEEFFSIYGDSDCEECEMVIRYAHFCTGLALRQLSRPHEALQHMDWVIKRANGTPDPERDGQVVMAAYYQRWRILCDAKASDEEVEQAANDVLLRFPDSTHARNVRYIQSMAVRKVKPVNPSRR